MDVDLGRTPPVAQAALRWVEDLAHRVRMSLIRRRSMADPVAVLIRSHRRVHSNGDAALIRRGYEVAERHHRGQIRKSGEAYITHPLAVAQILADLGMDTTTLVAALLHDTVEDTPYTIPELYEDFGAEVARLVDGVTKFEKALYGESAETETIRKMLVAADADVRVLIIKVADRLHNMRTIEARSTASRARIALATQDVLIPLCDRLGIQALKRDLEDSVLAALEPGAHGILQTWVAHRPEWTAYTDSFIGMTASLLRAEKIPAQVVSRPRHLSSVWKDTFAKGYEEPYELPRIAIIVTGAENDCYTALGAVHSTWRPVSGRFKDFIAAPKNNLYRSLHTTVIGPDDRAVEILIRTADMHRNAEYGIAGAFRARRGPGAHSARGRSRGVPVRVSGEHLAWLRSVVEWQTGAVDGRRFLESLRCDLAEGQVHVFAGGRRLLLPANSTPIDVAYAGGAEVGDRCVAATVNGQLAFLSSPLADGDVVEIHTAPMGETRGADGRPIGPSPEWLTFVRTPNAQLQIERRLGTTGVDPEHAPPVPFAARVRIGRKAIHLELRQLGRGLATDGPMLDLCAELGYPDVDSMLVAVADHDLAATSVARDLVDRVDNGAVQAALAAAIPRKP
jgi:guanosine-3',5'-bis(diphosphate) 3'-pyrophosphohydrolase